MKSKKFQVALANAVAAVLILIAVTFKWELSAADAADLAGYVVVAIGWVCSRWIDGHALTDAAAVGAKKVEADHG